MNSLFGRGPRRRTTSSITQDELSRKIEKAAGSSLENFISALIDSVTHGDNRRRHSVTKYLMLNESLRALYVEYGPEPFGAALIDACNRIQEHELNRGHAPISPEHPTKFTRPVKIKLGSQLGKQPSPSIPIEGMLS